MQCAVLVANRLQPCAPWLDYLQVILRLMAYYFWLPFCAIVLSLLLLGNTQKSVINWKVILFLSIFLFLAQFRFKSFEFLFINSLDIPKQYLTTPCSGLQFVSDLSLLHYIIDGRVYNVELAGIWKLLIPILLVLLNLSSLEKVGLQTRWNRQLLLVTLCFAAFILFRFLLSLYLGKMCLATTNWSWNLVTALYPQIVYVAIREEIAFRGILQTYLSTKLSVLPHGEFFAVLITALLFGVWHYPFASATWYNYAFTGFIIGWAYSKTSNLWVSIGLHGLNNILLHNIFLRG
jgi:membrane protease YdiL (CAAX protease family)